MNAIFRNGDDFVAFGSVEINHCARFVVAERAVRFFGHGTAVFGNLSPFLGVVGLVGIGSNGLVVGVLGAHCVWGRWGALS